MKKRYFLYLCLFLFIGACVDPFHPPVISSGGSLLVVEGFINGGASGTTINLSRTVDLQEKSETLTELKAIVTVEGNDNSQYSLKDMNNGAYSAVLSSISSDKQYRLRIKTKNGKEYLSDFVKVNQGPPIDSLEWKINTEKQGIQFYVNAHDAHNSTRYYQWEFIETWQYHADCNNPYAAIDTYYCWKSEKSSSIYVNSSSNLSEDIVSHFPLNFIDAHSEKVAGAYSIIVNQYAIDKSAYEYLQLLKKTTELQGSIFDPLPSQLTGNIHCVTDPQEIVLGYLSAHSVEAKRIFVLNIKLPGWFYPVPNYFFCPPPDDGSDCDPSPTCSDCRKHGGTIVKPDFWIY